MYKDNTLIQLLINWLNTHFNVISGVILAFCMSVARGYMFTKDLTIKHQLIDGFVCACLTLSCTGLLSIFELPENLIIFVGSLLGFIGAEQIRTTLLGFIVEKFKSKKDD